MTRAQFITLVEELLDAVGSARYGTTLKLQALTQAHDAGWKRILRTNRTYRVQELSLAQDALGQIPITSLTTGTGNNAKRFYRLLAAANGTTYYAPVNDQFAPLEPSIRPTGGGYTVSRMGDNLQFTPVESGAVMRLAVSHLPTAPDDLASDASEVTWPEGHEWVLAYEAASLLASKGAGEVGASLFNKDQANEQWRELLAEVSRFSVTVPTIRPADDISDWGG